MRNDNGKINLGPPPHPTDRERQLALEIGRIRADGSSSHAVFLTATARMLAQYRVELAGRGAREAAYALVERDLRDRQIDSVALHSSHVAVGRSVDETIARPAEASLLAAVDLVEPRDGKERA